MSSFDLRQDGGLLQIHPKIMLGRGFLDVLFRLEEPFFPIEQNSTPFQKAVGESSGILSLLDYKTQYTIVIHYNKNNSAILNFP